MPRTVNPFIRHAVVIGAFAGTASPAVTTTAKAQVRKAALIRFISQHLHLYPDRPARQGPGPDEIASRTGVGARRRECSSSEAGGRELRRFV